MVWYNMEEVKQAFSSWVVPEEGQWVNTKEWNPKYAVTTPDKEEASGVRTEGNSRGGSSRGINSGGNFRGRNNSRGGGYRGGSISNRGNYNSHYDYSGGQNSDSEQYRAVQDWNSENSGIDRGGPTGQSRRGQGYGQDQATVGQSRRDHNYGYDQGLDQRHEDDSRRSRREEGYRSDRDNRRRSGSRDSRREGNYGTQENATTIIERGETAGKGEAPEKSARRP